MNQEGLPLKFYDCVCLKQDSLMSICYYYEDGNAKPEQVTLCKVQILLRNRVIVNPSHASFCFKQHLLVSKSDIVQ